MDFEDFKKLVAILRDEREFVRNELIPKKGSLGRRVLTHLVFADCEVVSYYLKDSVNADCDIESIGTAEWLASMSDQYVFNEDGDVREREKRFRTLPHLLFVLKYTAKHIGKELDPKTVAGWEHVIPAFEVRNRITHPKEPTALQITPEDIEHIQALDEWLASCLDKLTL